MFYLTEHQIYVEQAVKSLADSAAGAVVCFEGRVRNHQHGKAVDKLFYEAYDELALSEGQKILEEAKEKFDCHHIKAIHRTGELEIAEVAVWVGVSASHREDAYAANRYVIDELKHRLPIWKQEFFTDGSNEWVNCQACAKIELTEKEYYDRQTLLAEVGLDGQQKLKGARVLVVGAGGLGCAALQYLAGAGVGTIGIVDADDLEVSNLHRQTLYSSSDVGKPKAELVKARLMELNPLIHINAIVDRFEISNAEPLVKSYDIVLDCSDNFKTKFLINDAAVLTGTPAIFASVYQMEGQLSVVAAQSSSACLRCDFSQIPSENCIGSCEEAGILGVVPGQLGIMQATEAIKIILGQPSPLSEKQLLCDLTTWQNTLIQRSPNSKCLLCGPNSVIVELLPELYNAQPDWDVKLDLMMLLSSTLIDIRETDEVMETPLQQPSKHLPLSVIDPTSMALNPRQKYIFICAKGKRSKALVQQLRRFGHDNVYSLQSGIEAYPELYQPREEVNV